MNSRAEAGTAPFTAKRLPSRWGTCIGAGILSLALLITGCGGHKGPSPEKVAIQWRQAREKGDFEAAWNLEDPDHRDRDQAAYVAFWENARTERLRLPTAAGHEVTDIEAIKTIKDDTQKEDFVFVYLRVTERDYGSRQQIVTLHRVDGTWRVAKWEP